MNNAADKERIELVGLAGWAHFIAGQLLIERQQATRLQNRKNGADVLENGTIYRLDWPRKGIRILRAPIGRNPSRMRI